MGTRRRTPPTSGGPSRITTPDAYPTTPPGFSADQHTWMLQCVMELQKSMGAHTEALENLQAAQEKTNESVQAVAAKVQTAQTVLWVVGLIIAGVVTFTGFMISNLVSALPALLQK